MKARTIRVTTDNLIEEIEIDFSDYRSLKRAIGGYFETVHTQKMYDYFKEPILILKDFPYLKEEKHGQSI